MVAGVGSLVGLCRAGSWASWVPLAVGSWGVVDMLVVRVVVG